MPLKRQTSLLDPFKLDDDDYKLLITPNTEKLCLQFINSIPTQQFVNDDEFAQTPINLSALLTPQLLSVNPFSIELTATNPQYYSQNNTESINTHTRNFNDAQLGQIVTLDHDYTPCKRQKTSCMPDESTRDSTLAESMTSAQSITTECSTPSKKRRAKGVYRKEDVTNEQELESYLERRKKNNFSSKQSRLAKKNLNQSMDDKADQLEDDNERLKLKINELESLTKLMKDALLKRFTSS